MVDLNANYAEVVADGGKAAPGFFNGKVHTLIDKITLAAEAGVGDTFDLLELPEGAIIIDALTFSVSLGTTGIYDVGLRAYENFAGEAVSEDQDSLIYNSDAGGQAVLGRATLASVGLFKQIGKGGAKPFVEFTEASQAGIGDTVWVAIQYAMP